MTDQQLFENVLNSIATKRGLVIRRPYNDTYIQLYEFDEFVGDMNYGGFTLEHNIIALSRILER